MSDNQSLTSLELNRSLERLRIQDVPGYAQVYRPNNYGKLKKIFLIVQLLLASELFGKNIISCASNFSAEWPISYPRKKKRGRETKSLQALSLS